MFRVTTTTTSEDEVTAMAIVTVEDAATNEDGSTTITGWVHSDWSDVVAEAVLANAECIGYAENGDVLPECKCLTCITEGGYNEWSEGRKGGYGVTATIPTSAATLIGKRVMLSGLFLVTDGESVTEYRTITNYEWDMVQDIAGWTDYHCLSLQEWTVC